MKTAIRGCLESSCGPSEPLPLRARYAIRRLPGEAPEHQPTHRQIDHRFTALQEVFIIFAQAAVAPDPGQRAFHHPPAGQDRKRWHWRWFDIHGIPSPASGPLDDLQAPTPVHGQPQAQRVTPIGHVGPHASPLREGGKRRGQEPGRRGRLTQIGCVDQDTQEETRRLNEEMALAAVEFFGAIVAVRPPFSVVFTVCASTMAAEGCE